MDEGEYWVTPIRYPLALRPRPFYIFIYLEQEKVANYGIQGGALGIVCVYRFGKTEECGSAFFGVLIDTGILQYGGKYFAGFL